MELVDELSLFLPEGATKVPSAGPSGDTSAFTRRADLFLTREQVTAILPILTDLAGSKQITTEAAERAQKGVDALLSDAQKDEYKELVATRESAKRGAGSGPGGAPAGAPGGGPGTDGGAGGGPGGPPPGSGQGRQNDSAMLQSLVDALRARLQDTTAQQ